MCTNGRHWTYRFIVLQTLVAPSMPAIQRGAGIAAGRPELLGNLVLAGAALVILRPHLDVLCRRVPVLEAIGLQITIIDAAVYDEGLTPARLLPLVVPILLSSVVHRPRAGERQRLVS